MSSSSGPENTAKPFSLLNRSGHSGRPCGKIGSPYALIRAARRVPRSPRPYARKPRLVTTSVTHPSCLPWQENEPKRAESTRETPALAAEILPTGTGRIRHQSNGEACANLAVSSLTFERYIGGRINREACTFKLPLFGVCAGGLPAELALFSAKDWVLICQACWLCAILDLAGEVTGTAKAPELARFGGPPPSSLIASDGSRTE